MKRIHLRRPGLLLARTLSLPLLLAGCNAPAAGMPPIRLGALFPLQNVQASLAGDEFLGLDIARQMVNADGGVHGRRIEFDSRELDAAPRATAAVGELRSDGVPLIIGTYSSALSLPASAAAADAGITYWEAGAVADRVTGRGLPSIFRVGASGANLGSNSAAFAAQELAPRLGKSPAHTRVSVVLEDDDYGRSVADAAITAARARGLNVVGRTTYNAYHWDFDRVITEVRAAAPDVVILASYIPDGIQFRRAMLAAHLRVGAFIGSTMAECGPEFGAALGADAVGVFASDRPTSGFNERLLTNDARAAHDRFVTAWRAQRGRDVTEEALAGFTAGWVLMHTVLPAAARLDATGIAAAARRTELPQGALPNGGGLQFAADAAHLGQNLRAAAVIWQWQAVRRSVTVWPAFSATGTVKFVPLPA